MKFVNVLALFVIVAVTCLFTAETRDGATAIAIQRAAAELSAQTKPSRKTTLPLIHWVHGIETAPALKQTGIEEIAVPAAKLEEWRRAGFNAHAFTEQHVKQRERLLVPRVAGRVNVASATRRPWIDSNGWRFMRSPTGKFYYDLTERAGSATLAMAESFTYQADAILKIEQTDLAAAGRMLVFLRALPQTSLPLIADIGLIDDGSAATGEVMNLLIRRNLLFKVVSAPAPHLRLNIKLGSKEYPRADASDPSAFVLKVRRQLGDENRSLRIFGSEIVISRLAGDGTRLHLHLINYSGRDVDSLRVRLRGKYAKGELKAFGTEQVGFEDFVVADDGTEFTIPKLGVYALIELRAVR